MNDYEKAEKLQLIIHDVWEWLAKKHHETGLKESEYLDVIDKLRNDQSIIEGGFLAIWKRVKQRKKFVSKGERNKVKKMRRYRI